MQFKIENAHLKQSIELLLNLPLKGKESRHRSKLIKKMQERYKEVEEQRIELAKEHAEKDEEGEPVIKDGIYQFGDNKQSFAEDLKELYTEQLIIEGGDNQEMLKTVKEVLENCEEEFSGNEAMVYDYLCEQFEEAK